MEILKKKKKEEEEERTLSSFLVGGRKEKLVPSAHTHKKKNEQFMSVEKCEEFSCVQVYVSS